MGNFPEKDIRTPYPQPSPPFKMEQNCKETGSVSVNFQDMGNTPEKDFQTPNPPPFKIEQNCKEV